MLNCDQIIKIDIQKELNKDYNFSFLMHDYEQYFIFTGGRKFNFQR